MQTVLGLDIGSSSVKASLVDVATGHTVAAAQSPAEEMAITASQPGWAEQQPEDWWHHAVQSVQACLRQLRQQSQTTAVAAIGISYQMHGLVVLDKAGQALRPAIIWCDSRAVSIGAKANQALGEDYCLEHYLNSPGNFTASKLRWVKAHEPHLYERIHTMMLPGDYIAYRLTGEMNTTHTGLSEGIFWDYQQEALAHQLLDEYELDKALIPPAVPVFSNQGKLHREAAAALGLTPGIQVAYRAGDQPNNAFSLNVLNPGETAATAGTSGVIYSVTDQNAFDRKSRVNTFIHVNNQPAQKRNGVLLCVNGTGILNSWLRKTLKGEGAAYAYEKMNQLAAAAPVGAEGLVLLPFGNGAERMLENKDIHAGFLNLDFNRHQQPHLLRAAQEGIVFALKYGFDILQDMGVTTSVIRAGKANMFLSPLFREAFVNTIGAPLQLYDTDGAKGAALGAGVGAGVYASSKEALQALTLLSTQEPEPDKQDQYQQAYANWKQKLEHQLKAE